VSPHTLVELHDLDLLADEMRDPESRGRLKKLGFDLDDSLVLEKARARLVEAMERRWLTLYDRARSRYGRAVARVRERVCLGCFVTLPTSVQPRPGETDSLGLCESCGRILYWG
jgi:predicted  nucleic acid-binding Zn-ribbon protein